MAQNERECKEFKFKQLIKLEVDKWSGPLQNRVQRVAVASKYGLAFVASNLGFKALKVVDVIKKDIENPNCANEVIKDFKFVADINLQLCPDDLSVSSDSQFLSVCVTKNGFVFALIYSVSSFVQGSGPVKPLSQIKLSSGDGQLMQLMWNPGSDYASVFASAVSDGSLTLWQVTAGSFSQLATRPQAAGKCLCWSPKGKQLVVGTKEGKLIQYDQNLTEKKAIPGPSALFNGQPFTAVDVVWESTFVFLVAYLLLGSEHEQPHLVHVVAQKGKEPVYTDLDDACFGGGEGRTPRYYSVLVPEWKMLLLGSATSLEAAVLGRALTDEAQWERWILDDAGRAEIPMTEDYEEVFPMGFAVDFSSDIQVPIGDTEMQPPCPVLLILGTNGTLICYYMVHSTAPSIQRKPEVEVCVQKTLTGELATTPVKPVVTTQQSSLVVSQGTSQTKQPEVLPVSTPTPKVPATSVIAKPVTSAPSVTTTPGQNKQPLFGVAQSSTPGQQTQRGFGHTTGSPSGASTQVKLPVCGGSSPSSQSVVSTPSQVKQPVVSTTTPTVQGVTTVPSQVKPPAFGTPTPFAQSGVTALNQQKPGLGFSPALSKAPAANGTFSFAMKAEQAQKPGVLGTGEARSGQVLGGQSATKLQSTESSVTSRTLVKQPTVSSSGSVQASQPHQTSKSTAKGVIQEGPVKQPTSLSPTKRSASREEESGVRAGSSTHGKSASGQDHFMKALIEEMQHFQQELNEFKQRGAGVSEAVGSKEEMTDLHRATESVVRFCEEMKVTTQSINNEIYALKTECLEEFATLEECRAREERNQNPKYRHLLGARSLDPVSERKMRSIRSQAHYLDGGIQDVHSKLDLEWEEHQRRRRNGRKLKCPTTDTIYRTLKNNKHVISTQQTALENVCSGVGKPHLGKIRAPQSGVASPADTGQWTPSLGGSRSSYQPRSLLGASTTPRSVTRSMSSGSPQRVVGVSPEKQSKLRDLLGSRVVTPVKSTAPGNLTMSRFWSSDLPLDDSAASPRPPLQTVEESNVKDMSKSTFNTKKNATVKSPDSVKPQMRADTHANKENQKSALSFSAPTCKPADTKTPTPTFSFSKGSSEFTGFGSKPLQTSRESGSGMLSFNTSTTNPAPNFAFSKTSTPVTKSSTPNTGFSVAAKPDSPFNFNKSSSQEGVAAMSKPGLLSTSSSGLTVTPGAFNFNKPSTEKTQVTSNSSGQGTFTFGAKTLDSFTFSKPPDTSKTAEPKTVSQASSSEKPTKTLDSMSSKQAALATGHVNPRSRPGTNMSGSFSFPIQAADEGNDTTGGVTTLKGDAKATSTGFGITTGATQVQPDSTIAQPESSSEAIRTMLEVGQKHLQFGSALAEVLAEESAPAPTPLGKLGESAQLSVAGVMQSQEPPSSLFTPSTKTGGFQATANTASPQDTPHSAPPTGSMIKDVRSQDGQGVSIARPAVITETADVMVRKDPPTKPGTQQKESATGLSDKTKTPVLVGAVSEDRPTEDVKQSVDSLGPEESLDVPPAQVSTVTTTSYSAENAQRKVSSDDGNLGALLTTGQLQKQGDSLPCDKGNQLVAPPTAGPSNGDPSFTQSGGQHPTPSTTVEVSQQLTTPVAQSTGQLASTSTGFSFGTGQPASTNESYEKPQTTSTSFSFGTGQPGQSASTSESNNKPQSTGFNFGSVSGGTQQSSSATGFSFGTAQGSTEKTVPVTASVSSTAQSGTQQTTSSGGFSFGGTQSVTSDQPVSTGGFGASFGSQQTPSSAGFSFGTPVSSGNQPSVTFGFGQSTSQQQPTGSGDGMKGMESEGANATQDSSLFGGSSGLFGGLGGKPSAENANKNVFGGTFSTGNTGSANQGGALFGSQNTGSSGSGFGGFGNANQGFPSSFQGSTVSSASQGGLFSNTSGGVSSTGFGLGSQSSPQKPAAFGGAPVFGSGMTSGGFGSPPSFGSTPTFGGSGFSNNAPVFGSSSSAQGSSGFASFVNSGAPSFGNLAQQNTPTFGNMAQDSGGFGAAQNTPQGFGSGPVFGGTPKMTSPSFSSYRS